MEAFVLNTESLPLPIRENLRTAKVTVQEHNGGIFLLPVKEGSGLFGIAEKDSLTVEKFRTYKKEDKGMDIKSSWPAGSRCAAKGPENSPRPPVCGPID